MARSVVFDFRRGSGAPTEIMFGTVTIKPSMMFFTGSSAVLPSPSSADLIAGKATVANVAPSPNPVGGTVEWAYEVAVISHRGETFKWLVGVPDGTAAINFNALPRYYDTKPPLFGQGPQGPPGAAATLDIGTVTASASGSNPTITNSGTDQNAILDFVLPRGTAGATGAKGDKGDKGDVGPKGDPGVNIKGHAPTSADFPLTGNTAGDGWIADDTGYLWIWDGATWASVGGFQGPPGADSTVPGPEGPEGPQGPPGPGASPYNLINALPTPTIVAHRGGAAVFPEESMEALRASARDGFCPEMDITPLKNGELAMCHDTTANRTMSGVTGALSGITLAQWRSARINHPVNGGRSGRPALFEDALDELGGKTVLVPEIKSAATAATVDKTIAAIKDRGLENSVIVQSVDFAICSKIAAAGIQALFLFNTTSTTTPAQLAAANIKYVGVGVGATAATITSYKGAGLIVWVWTVNTFDRYNTAISRGAQGVFTDDPWLLTRSIPKQSSMPRPGLDGYPGNYAKCNFPASAASTVLTRVVTVSEESFTINAPSLPMPENSSATAGGNIFAAAPWAGPIKLPVTISMNMEYSTAAVGTPSSVGSGFCLFNNTVNADAEFYDRAEPGQNGYTVSLRRNGQVQIWRYVNGTAASSIASTPSTNWLNADQPGRATILVTITATSVIVRIPELQVSAEATTTNFNPANMNMMFRSGVGHTTTFRDITITEGSF